MSRADPGKNSEPSESKMSLELRPTAPSDLGRSNEAFQDEDLERQNTPGNSTVRNRVVQSGEQGHAKQDDRQITIEQEPLGNKEDPEDDSEDEHQKGYSGTYPVVWFILCFVFLLYSLLFLNFTMLH